MKKVKVLISGHVQGVYFRTYIRDNALNLDINGYVKNVDNEVEAVFEGEDEQVDELIDLCAKGPGKVENIKVEEYNSNEKFDEFVIKY